jgi:hypothetical protein
MARSHNKIVVKAGNGVYDEGVAKVALTPGMGVVMDADTKLRLPGSADEAKTCLKIVINQELGGENVDTPIAIDDLFQYFIPSQGSRVNVLVKSGQNIAIADFGVLETGTGKFIEATALVASTAVCRVQFKESSGGALGADRLMLAEVL